MKIQKGDDLFVALDRCSKFTRESSLIPEYLCVNFSSGVISASNGYSGIICLLDNFATDKTLFLPGKKVVKLLEKLDTISDITGFDTSILVKTEKSNHNFILFKSGTEIVIPQLPSFDDAVILPTDFLNCINEVYFSVNKDLIKKNMCGVAYKEGFVYSTDNFRVSRFPCSIDIDYLFIPDCILEKILSFSFGLVPKLVSDDLSRVWLLYEESVLVYGSYSGKFPNFSTLFNEFNVLCEVCFNKAELLNVLSRFEDVVDEYPYQINIIIENDMLKISGKSFLVEASEEIAITSTNYTSKEVSFNLKFFKEMVVKADRFYVGDKSAYFLSDSGYQGILLFLE